MATIERRTDSKGLITYRAKVRLQGHPHYTRTFSRKTDAKDWARALEADIKRGKTIPSPAASRRTVAGMIDRYIDEYLPIKDRNKDANKTAALLNWWKREIGSYALANLSAKVITAKRDTLTGGVTYRGTRRSKATVNRYLSALSHVLKIAVQEWGWLEDSPMRGVGRYTESTGRTRWLEDDERNRLLEACLKSKNPDLHTIVVLALSTGARSSEIRYLTWTNVDLHAGFIRLADTKNGYARNVPLVGRARELLRQRSAPSGYVFPSPRNPNKPLYFRTSFENAVARAGLTRNVTFHSLRHCAASYLAMNQATASEIAQILGHRTLQMVKRYTHIADLHSQRVVAKMNEKIFAD
jgi:integrase